MFVTQPIVPRSKEWLPLATNQLRLRSLIQILAFSIKRDGKDGVIAKGLKSAEHRGVSTTTMSERYYYTLHSTMMSAPFYTSEKVNSDSPKWKEIEVNSFEGNVSNSADAFVIRLWSSTKDLVVEDESDDEMIAIWGVYLNGLTYLGQNLGTDIPLKPNSIVFLMPGGYFTDVNCLEATPKIRYVSVAVNQSDVQHSYTVSTLTRLHTIQQVIRKELAEVDLLKQKISMGDVFKSETRGRTVLRRLLSKNKPRISHQDYVKAKENIEVAKYRVHVLREEKSTLSFRLRELKNRIEILSDENRMMESKIMEKYRLLTRKVQIHRESKREHISRRESQLHSKAKLNFRAKQLVSELNLIYPIVEKSPEKFTICGVHLPNSEDFAGHDEIQISVALGFVTHVIQMISIFLQVPLRYPVIHFGSRSRIVDHVSEKIPDSEREFPLYLKGKEKLQFHYAVYLLNKNIAQLRWLCGLPTLDLRNTLANLSSLVKMKSENSIVDSHGNKSVSSSTADVCSSCLSVSSPVGSVLSLSNKKNSKGHRDRQTSESCAESATKATASRTREFVAGHRISKSVGSAKDFVVSIFPASDRKRKRSHLGAKDAAGITNTFSYSLDEGLNEYEGVSGSDSARHRVAYAADSYFNSSVAKDSDESKEKDSFLKSWEADKNCGPFSDDDSAAGEASDKIESGVAAYNNVPHFEAKRTERSRATSGDGLDFAEIADEATVDARRAIASAGGDVDDVAVQVECDANILTGEEIAKCDDDARVIVADSLLESVTSRTEALASQTTSFNRFRSRFKSALENSS